MYYTDHAASSCSKASDILSDQDWLVDTQFLLNLPQMKQSGLCSLDLEVNLPGNAPRDPSPLPPNQINSSTLSGLPASVYSCWPREHVKHGTDDRRNTVKHQQRRGGQAVDKVRREGQRYCYQRRKELGGRAGKRMVEESARRGQSWEFKRKQAPQYQRGKAYQGWAESFDNEREQKDS